MVPTCMAWEVSGFGWTHRYKKEISGLQVIFVKLCQNTLNLKYLKQGFFYYDQFFLSALCPKINEAAFGGFNELFKRCPNSPF